MGDFTTDNEGNLMRVSINQEELSDEDLIGSLAKANDPVRM